MTRNEKILAVIILVQALAMPFISRYTFRLGYFTAKEIWRGSVMIVPPPPTKPPTQKGAVTL